MKQFLAIALTVLMAVMPGMVGAQNIPNPPPTNNAVSAASGPAGTVTTPSGLLINVSPGPVYCQGDMGLIGSTQFTLQANQFYHVVFDCSKNVLLAQQAAAIGPFQIELATAQAGASTVTTITDLRIPGQFPSTADGYFIVPPGACAWNQSGGTLVTNGLANVGASFLAVNQISTTTTTLTTVLSCQIAVPTKLNAGKGITINDVVLLYGPSTGTLQSCAAPAINQITVPTPGAAETPSTVTPVVIPGSLTVTPVVGSCNVTALTPGALYSEKVALGTPFNWVTDLTTLQFSQSFVGANAASEILYTAGLIVHYTYIPL